MSYIFGKVFGIEGSLEPDVGPGIFVNLPAVAETLAAEITNLPGCEDFIFHEAQGPCPMLKPSDSLICRTFTWISQNGYATEEIWKASLASNISRCSEDFITALRQKFSQECRSEIGNSSSINLIPVVCLFGALLTITAGLFLYKKSKENCRRTSERDPLLGNSPTSAYSTDAEL